MCKIMEDMRNESAERRSVDIALKILQDGKLSLEEVAKYSMLAIERVMKLAMPGTAQ